MKSVVNPLLAILLLVGAVGFGVVQFYEARRLRLELAELGQERDRLLEKTRLPAGPIPLAGSGGGGPSPLNSPTNQGEEGEAAAPGPVAVNTPANVARGPGGRFNAMNTPEFQQLMAIQQKAALDGRYAALFRRLNLSPAELDQFKHLLVEKQAVVMDVMAAARSQGMGGRENRDDLRVIVESTQAEVDEGIRAALGEAAYAQYKTYETTLPQRGLVDQLGQRLSYSTTPLSDAQADQLVGILAANTPASGAGSRNPGATPMITGFPRAGAGGGIRVTDEVIMQARSVLSGQQLSALQSLQQEQQAAAALTEQLRLNRQNSQRTGPAPATPGGG